MGCNCKKQEQVINNLNSQDHLSLARSIYEDVITKKSIDEYDDLDKKQVLFGFYSLYPNVKIDVSYQHAVTTITNVVETLK